MIVACPHCDTLNRLPPSKPAREGKCGRCEYVNICGGSRSRAYALTGDYLAEDPRCTYQPTRQKERECQSCAGCACESN